MIATLVSIWQSQTKLIFQNELSQGKRTKLAKHTWQIRGYQLDSGNHADQQVTLDRF